MVDVTLPSLGESVTEGVITRWFKRVGDPVARDEALLEVSTDKVDSELPSPATGVLSQILAGEGDTVETGARVAVIDEGAEALPDATSKVAPSPPDALAPPRSEVATASSEGPGGLVLSPVVRRILSDGGVEPGAVSGTGPGGTITRRDAERAVAQGPSEEFVLSLSKGRRRMGLHMALSSQSTPHGFVAVEVDGAIFEELDRRGRATRDGVAISDEMVASLAAVRALGEYEFLNATFVDDELVVHRTVNLGLTRVLEPDGMLVPVVHAAAGLTLRALARRVADLDERLATRRLTADDLMGGTFTVAGAPSPNTVFATPIIIPPEVAVLSLGAVRDVALVSEERGAKQITPGRRLVLGLSFDHRVCEQNGAASYLERVGELLGGLDLESER